MDTYVAFTLVALGVLIATYTAVRYGLARLKRDEDCIVGLIHETAELRWKVDAIEASHPYGDITNVEARRN